MGIFTHPLIGMFFLAPFQGGTDYITFAEWSEGKAMMGTIASTIRAYAMEKGPSYKGPLPTTLKELDFEEGDFNGNYFEYRDFSFKNQFS